MYIKKAKQAYQKRVEYYSKISNKLFENINSISTIRFIVAIATIVSTIFFERIGASYSFWVALLVGTAIFIYLVIVHKKLKNKHKYITNLEEIYTSSIMRLEGGWIEFQDGGLEFKDEEHSYSYDLDIFGQGSLFQWINTAKTHMGRSRLANIFEYANDNKEIINKRQQSINELSKKLWWRQRLQAEAKMIIHVDSDINDLLSWARNRNDIFNRTLIVMMVRLVPVVTILTLLLSYGTNIIPRFIPFFLLFTQAIMILLSAYRVSQEFAIVHKYHGTIKAYRRILNHFEKTKFYTGYINELKSRLINDKGITAVEQLKKLEIILNRALNRKNMMFFPINVITLWDYQCMIDLEKWRRQSGLLIEEWLKVIGELEALSSLAVIRYDYPNWSMPIITEGDSIINARSMGHPLLTNKQVYNDVTLQEPSRVLLITGSNMSGKSTFLRTIGINLILAYSGAPVCATDMTCSIFNLHTCMRTSDNLEKGISSFYGELLKIKNILNATKEDKKVFFLLDEIFKGTNSYDRHIGAKMLIKQLYNNGASGLVSTHDLELGDMETENKSNVKNFHFREYYKDNKIYFDYKLRQGISTTRNALYLIKMIGIETDDMDKTD